jgi:acetylornithine deacetylase/succinyl-diaminopimelate desuccinylase-like protein
LAKFAEPVFPVTLTPETRAFFPAVAAAHEPEMAYAMRHLDHPDSADAFASLVGQDLLFAAMLRNTVSPTMIEGGFRANVIPATAEATLNCRLLPGSDAERLASELRRQIDDPAITVTPATPGHPPAPSVPSSGPVVDAVERIAGEMAPGAPVVPFLSASATDSADLRLAGIAAYGLLPFPITTEDAGRMHGNEERMPVASLEFGLKMMFRVTRAVVGP